MGSTVDNNVFVIRHTSPNLLAADFTNTNTLIGMITRRPWDV